MLGLSSYDWVFVALALVLAGVSSRALRDPRSHGFFRFFAFESIVFLLWSNLPYWFADRFAAHQLLSWLLLFSALYLLIHGLLLLRIRGGHAPEREAEQANFAFENTARLVTEGLYGYVRHPLYASLLLLTWGIFCKQPSVATLLAAGVGSMALFMTARVEEAENLRSFGEQYLRYMQRTRMFIPFVW